LCNAGSVSSRVRQLRALLSPDVSRSGEHPDGATPIVVRASKDGRAAIARQRHGTTLSRYTEGIDARELGTLLNELPLQGQRKAGGENNPKE
jgi:hypothetical protein